jgi:hypothetical protein
MDISSISVNELTIINGGVTEPGRRREVGDARIMSFRNGGGLPADFCVR